MTKTRIVDVGAVGVPVTDQDQALEFYVGKLASRSVWTCRCPAGDAGSR